MPMATASGSDATVEADEMDQIIQTIVGDDEDSGEVAIVFETSDPAATSETTDSAVSSEVVDNTAASGTAGITDSGSDADAQQEQIIKATEDSTSTISDAAQADQSTETIKEAETMDLLIKVLVEDEGSLNGKAVVDQGSGAETKKAAINQSSSASNKFVGEAAMEGIQESETLNKTQTMSQMIQMLVDSSGDSGSTPTQETKTAKGIETVAGQSGQPSQPDQEVRIPGPVEIMDAILEEAAVQEETQVEIQVKTESMGLMIETIAISDSILESKDAQSQETIGETEASDQLKLIDTIAGDKGSAEGSDNEADNADNGVDGSGCQETEIANEVGLMDSMILGLESSLESSSAQENNSGK